MPFFSVSASEFVEAIVGIGASRVRDLFKQAKESSPAIIFIDELDAIGRSRTRRLVAVRRRQRRARADAQPDPHGDGRLRVRRGRDRARRDQPARDPRPGAAAPGPLRPPRRRCRRPTRTAAARSSRSTRARCRSTTTSTSTRSPPARPAWSAPTWPTSPTRRRCWPPAATTSRSSTRTSPRRWRRSSSARRARMVLSEEDRRRTAYHESGHALVGMLTAGRGPGAQGLDHPARDGARRDALGARRREVQLRGALPAGQDQGRARRPRRGGDRLRDDHRRRGVRHPAADRDRAPDGRALGDERVDRADRRAPVRRPGPAAAGRLGGLRGHAARSSTARCGGSSTPPTPR